MPFEPGFVCCRALLAMPVIQERARLIRPQHRLSNLLSSGPPTPSVPSSSPRQARRPSLAPVQGGHAEPLSPQYVRNLVHLCAVWLTVPLRPRTVEPFRFSTLPWQEYGAPSACVALSNRPAGRRPHVGPWTRPAATAAEARPGDFSRTDNLSVSTGKSKLQSPAAQYDGARNSCRFHASFFRLLGRAVQRAATLL